MQSTLHTLQRKYFLNLGSKPSSPVMQFSAGLALQYTTQLANALPAEKMPFYLCVPDKEHFTVPFACTLLMEYLLENHYEPSKLELSLGDKVEIFGSVAQYIGMVTDREKPHIRLLFANNTTYNVPESYLKHMIILDKKRILNTIDRFRRKRRAYLEDNDLNALFKLGEKEAINSKGLNSKLYLVTGRGNVVSTRDKLKNESCINQSLEKVFRVDKNLVVIPDLEQLAPFFNTSENSTNAYFIEELTCDIEEIREVYDGNRQVLDLVYQLKRHLEKNDFSENFGKLFNQLVNSVEGNYSIRLLGLADYIPPQEIGLPDNLKVVVLNSINLANDYANTVNGLIARDIPVIILTDLKELTTVPNGESNILKNSYRFYWSREQVKELVNTTHEEYYDNKFWKQCTRYASQQIVIQSYSDPVGDRLFKTFESNSAFARLDGFEYLKKAYYEHLRPVLYLLKNTPGSDQALIKTVQEQADLFNSAFETIQNQLPIDLASAIAEELTELRNYNTNPKHLPDNQPVFVQQITFPNALRRLTAQSTPKELRINNLDKLKSDSLFFTGYPYREWNGKYLHNAVFCQLIPLITVLAWQAEAQRTTGYLLKRIRNGGFNSHLPQWISNGIPDWDVPYHKEQPDESNLIIQRGYTAASAPEFIAGPIQSETTFEDVQRYISNFRFASISSLANDTGPYLVSVDVLHFEDGSYMMLPKGRGGRIHFISSQNGTADKITDAAFHELSVGDVVVCFNMDQEVVRKLAREQLNEAYTSLDIWRSCLKRLLEDKNGDYTALSHYLKEQKELLDLSDSSPTRSNILRWFYESDMLAPQTSNLLLILKVFGLSNQDSLLRINQIKAAKSLIIRNSNQVSNRIKDKIIATLVSSQLIKDDILLDIDDVSVAVKFGRITDKEFLNDIVVPYTSTKKFIRD